MAVVLSGALGLGVAFLMRPVFTATTVLMPPQQPQGAAAALMASLGALAGVVGSGGGGAGRALGDQFVALLQSARVQDRIIKQFDLDRVYETDYRFQTRKELSRNVQIQADRRSGLISILVDDTDPQRAADIANAHVEQLRVLTGELAVTEAQQRRAFFEEQLKNTRDRLTAAQRALQESGFSQATLRAEPKAAAESYARLKAELTAAEVRLQVLRGFLVDSTPEVQQQVALVSGLRGQLARVEAAATPSDAASAAPPDYLSKYREFKYQESLFELFARQFEAARVDESREGPLLQVVDVATRPEYKSRPKRALLALGAALAGFVLYVGWIIIGHQARTTLASDPALAASWSRVRGALRGEVPRAN
jgi:capsule polysaccharide export protein KpsE/RkpR